MINAPLFHHTSRFKNEIPNTNRVITCPWPINNQQVPININNCHWAIAAINFAKRKVLYCDSKKDQARGRSYFKLLQGFLEVQAKRWRGGAVPEGFSASEWGALLDLGGSWEFESVATPTQENCCDCGPFTLGFASYIAKCIEENFPFSQEDIVAIRKRITYDLMYAIREV